MDTCALDVNTQGPHWAASIATEVPTKCTEMRHTACELQENSKKLRNIYGGTLATGLQQQRPAKYPMIYLMQRVPHIHLEYAHIQHLQAHLEVLGVAVGTSRWPCVESMRRGMRYTAVMIR